MMRRHENTSFFWKKPTDFQRFLASEVMLLCSTHEAPGNTKRSGVLKAGSQEIDLRMYVFLAGELQILIHVA